MQKIKLIYLLILIPLVGNSQQLFYQNSLNVAGNKYLILNEDNSYEYLWHRRYDVGDVNDTIHHYGAFVRSGDTLILNSYLIPDSSSFLDFTIDGSRCLDSISIYISSFDSIPLFMFAPNRIRINNKNYKLPKPNNDTIVFKLPCILIKFIVIPGYTVCRLNNLNTNKVLIKLKELDFKNSAYDGVDYFLNQKYIIKDNSLLELRDHDQGNVYLLKSIK